MGRLAGRLAALALAGALAPGPGGAAEVEVASPEALAPALEAAGPGDTLRLAPGDYGALTLAHLAGTPEAPVVIASADPADPARFSSMTVSGVESVELRGLVLDYTYAPGDPPYLRPFQVQDSRDVTLSGILLDGDDARGTGDPTADGFPTAFGLRVSDVEGFTLEGSEIRGFFRGLVVADSSDVRVVGNDLHGLRMDGMNFAQVEDVLIEGNRIRDFERSLASADHADMIQFWTNRTDRPSTGIVIRGNLLASGTGAYTQSIFMRNEEVDTGRRSFADMAYRDVAIEDNVIVNAQLHGITVGEADGLVIANNAVLRNPLSEGERDNPNLWTPRINVAPTARNVTIRGNVTARLPEPHALPSDWRIEGNLVVQDRAPSEPGYYGSVFAGMPGGDPRDPASFAPRPGGPLDGTGIGPAWLGRPGPP